MERFIDRYKPTVNMMINILAEVNVTQAECLRRVYGYAFVTRVFSDQDFFESVNWFALKCIRLCVVYAQSNFKHGDFAAGRDWTSRIKLIVELL